MTDKSAARRFAKALIDLGRVDNSCERLGRGLRTALGVFEGSPELYRVLQNPMYSLDERKGLMDKVSEAAGLEAPVAKFIDILVQTRSIRLLPDIVSAYVRYEDEITGRVRATVESPGELPEPVLAEIKEKLKAMTGKEIVLSSSTNSALLGGMVINMGNTVIDGSLKTQIEALRDKLIEGA